MRPCEKFKNDDCWKGDESVSELFQPPSMNLSRLLLNDDLNDGFSCIFMMTCELCDLYLR